MHHPLTPSRRFLSPLRILPWLAAFGTLLALSGCSKELPTLSLKPLVQQQVQDLPPLEKYRVEEWLTVVFPKDYSAEEWKRIFVNSQTLRSNTEWIRDHPADDSLSTEDAQTLERKVQENLDATTFLMERALLMVAWNESPACSFGREGANLKLSCEGHTPETPLLTPDFDPLFTRVDPNPVKDKEKSPYYKSRFYTKDYALLIQLRFDRYRKDRSGTERLYFSGNALPEKGSRFPLGDGKLESRWYPYGYTQLVLKKVP